jgi:CxxC motif-containing protein
MKEMICILCPVGCHLMIDESNDYAVTGNSCPKGIKYGKEELINPTRVVTSIVRVEGGIHHMVPVKTDKPVPKAMTFKVVEELKKIKIISPQKIGTIIIENVLNTGANIVLTRNI